MSFDFQTSVALAICATENCNESQITFSKVVYKLSGRMKRRIGRESHEMNNQIICYYHWLYTEVRAYYKYCLLLRRRNIVYLKLMHEFANVIYVYM